MQIDFSQKSELQSYQPKHKIRFLTATAIFDGHDASINIIRRFLQARGSEVIHLGHSRSAFEVARAAIQEGVHGVAVSSYQGGHMEYFSYLRRILDENDGGHIKLFGGGGGVISPSEVKALREENIAMTYTPEDGQQLDFSGIIGHMLKSVDQEAIHSRKEKPRTADGLLSWALSQLEQGTKSLAELKDLIGTENKECKVLGATGTGGAGKSSLLDELVQRFLLDSHKAKVAILCIDPTKKKTGGALLGDRIRMNSCASERVFLRSFATRDAKSELAKVSKEAVALFKCAGYDFVIVETSGIGQGNSQILELCDYSLYVMTPEYGASSQLEKIDMLDFADFIAVNKFERGNGEDALKDVETTIRRSRFFGQSASDYPLFGTIANRFNDPGTNGLYRAICQKLFADHLDVKISPNRSYQKATENPYYIVSPKRRNYLSEIVSSIRKFHAYAKEQTELAHTWEGVDLTLSKYQEKCPDLLEIKEDLAQKIDPSLKLYLAQWDQTAAKYSQDKFSYMVRGKEVSIESSFTTLSQLKLPRVSFPRYYSAYEKARYYFFENLPGHFPYTAGIFPYRRKGEDPQRQFAGEGGPSRTNKRFHYLADSQPAVRLSTAFDSVTLYGADPDKRPDIFGKIGESGVSIAHLDDMKELYRNFDLCALNVSVSMTINGPAPIILAMYINAAFDQQIAKFVADKKRQPDHDEQQSIYEKTVQSMRGTVQADILKENQAQNTCIFSTEFALKLMGDIQEYFCQNQIKNYYTVSISGYHIAEAGANPITQLAFTLANGFTYVEYYLARGLKIDDFAPNLSFFFSNGLDSEYAVLGRVARRIWAVAMRNFYQAGVNSQKLKYHIQTSGRSLHAQEMDFNDIRTTLQALLALYDNCNSLHTNAFDEALTTPTEASVRRAMAIQLIINQEFGPNKNENINQGSYFLEELTDLVEEAVLLEFERLSSRGGVLGAMETQYMRNKIQEESLYYEKLKHSGELPIIGVNTFVNPNKDAQVRATTELIRASYEEKEEQLARLAAFKSRNYSKKEEAKQALCTSVLEGKNVFAQLIFAVRILSLGEITEILFELGGAYRRSM